MPLIAEKEVVCRKENIILTNQRAIFWEKESMLMLADMHLGKTAHFRRHGIAIPASVMFDDLHRLSRLIDHFRAKKLVVVGDMFHAGQNTDLNYFRSWREEFPDLSLYLVKGNHDRLRDDQYAWLGINAASEILDIPPFHFSHHPENSCDGNICISGHVHPGRTIYGAAKQSMRLPCYIVGENQLILPAYSLFTGLDTRTEPEGKNEYYVFTQKEIFLL